MASDKTTIWIVLIGIVILLAFGAMIQKQYSLFSTMSGATMTRTVPSSVQPNSQFTITYSVSGVSGKWGVSIVDSVSGGCTFPAGTTLKSVLLSDEGTTKTIQVTAPSSGSCIFTGDYKFGTDAIIKFPDDTVIISSSAETPSTPSETTPTPSTPSETTPSFDLNQVLFKIGNFDVTLLMLIIGALILVMLFSLNSIK